MIDRKYLRNYTRVMIKCLDICTDENIFIVEDWIDSADRLLYLEEFLKTNPTESELMEEIKRG